MAKHIILGNNGEQMACNYLSGLGFNILQRNYRYKKAEIDIIASKEDLLLFVEVKTRKGKRFGEPEEAITQPKINLIIMAAEQFIEESNWLHAIRFDVIAIHYIQPIELTHIEDAFY